MGERTDEFIEFVCPSILPDLECRQEPRTMVAAARGVLTRPRLASRNDGLPVMVFDKSGGTVFVKSFGNHSCNGSVLNRHR
jgi:hypothetical protein